MNTMTRITLKLHIVDPIIITQKSATEGVHSTLDYIPGANILGALAGACYAKLKKGTPNISVFDVFHSGQVRFGNALPLNNNQASYPLPISFHYPKGEYKSNVYNQLQENSLGSVQLKQHREGYISLSNDNNLTHIKPKKDYHLRTAINPNTSTAKASQLFGYQSIQAGADYQAHIDVDTPELAQFIETELKRLKQIRVGRSKSSHYGRVNITSVTTQKYSPETTPILRLKNNKESIVLWLASDLVAYTTEGLPTLTPSLQDLGLKTGGEVIELDLKNTWIRTRSYSPYNAFRKGYDMEQQVIQQGSLLVYPNTDINLTQLQKGIGCYTQTGQGQIVPLQNGWQTVLQSATTELQEVDNLLSTPNKQPAPTKLINFLQKSSAQKEYEQKISLQVVEDIKRLCELYQGVRQYNAIPQNIPVGPSNTQWGRIRDLATQNSNLTKSKLKEKLFDSQNGIIKENDEAWQLKDNDLSFATFLKQKINSFKLDIVSSKSEKNDDFVTHYIRSLAKEAAQSAALKNARGGQ